MRSLSAVAALLFIGAISALTGAGCAANEALGRVCEGGCETGKSCVVGRCRAVDEAPAAIDARRVILAPSDFAVIAATGGSEAIPETVALGRAEGGTVALLLRFAASWHDDADVLSAFVVLDPLDSAPPAATPAVFESARILEPWQPSVVSWGRQPRLDLPRLAAVVRAIPGTPVRIDVTALVREWASRRADDHGLALLVHGDDRIGQAFSMGVSGGAGPRLEAYVR
ncbi:MAG: DNRLRE domain-containing protein [Byssovorax sp.]